MAPAEADQIVAHGFRQVTHIAVGFGAKRAMTLGELRAIRPVDQRYMGKLGNVPAERGVYLALTARIRQVVVAADDMCDAHVVIVHDDGQVIGRRAVATQDDEIIELFVRKAHLAHDMVTNDCFALVRRPKAHNGSHAGRCVGRVAIAPAAVVPDGAAFGPGFFAHLFELCLAGVAVVSIPCAQQLLSDFRVTRHS